MTIIQALLGEHGAMYPLLELIEKTTMLADLEEHQDPRELLAVDTQQPRPN